MTKDYKIALAEVNAILKLSDIEVIHKIPYNFRRYIVQNMDKTLKVYPDLSKDIENQDISKKAKIILALIYRDYLVTKEEKEKLKNNERNIQIKHQEKIRELYNPDNIFKKNTLINENEQNKSLMIIEEKNFFMKILLKLKSIFIKY